MKKILIAFLVFLFCLIPLIADEDGYDDDEFEGGVYDFSQDQQSDPGKYNGIYQLQTRDYIWFFVDFVHFGRGVNHPQLGVYSPVNGSVTRFHWIFKNLTNRNWVINLQDVSFKPYPQFCEGTGQWLTTPIRLIQMALNSDQLRETHIKDGYVIRAGKAEVMCMYVDERAYREWVMKYKDINGKWVYRLIGGNGNEQKVYEMTYPSNWNELIRRNP